MKYIYKMSRSMFNETLIDAAKCGMSLPRYITAYFGIIGECVRVEII